MHQSLIEDCNIKKKRLSGNDFVQLTFSFSSVSLAVDLSFNLFIKFLRVMIKFANINITMFNDFNAFG